MLVYFGGVLFSFFFNDTATTEIYTRSLVGSVKMCIRDRLNVGDVGARTGRTTGEPSPRGPEGPVRAEARVCLSLIHISEPTRPY